MERGHTVASLQQQQSLASPTETDKRHTPPPHVPKVSVSGLHGNC